MGVIARLRNGLIWNRALDLVAESNYEKALSTLLKINVAQYEYRKLDYYMQKAFLLFKNQDKGDVRAGIAEALTFIEEDTAISAAEADYRCKYLELLMARLYGHSAEIAVSYKNINLDNVPVRTKHYFPIRGHPNWVEVRY